MDVKIGLTQSPREVELELPDDVDVDGLKSSIEQALGNGTTVFWLTDRKGRQVGIAIEKLAYVDIGVAGERGRIGFGS